MGHGRHQVQKPAETGCKPTGSKHELPVRYVNPTSELESDLPELGDLAEAQLRMQSDTCRVRKGRSADHTMQSLAAEECRSLARSGRYDEARLVATRFDFHELPTPSGAQPLSSDVVTSIIGK